MADLPNQNSIVQYVSTAQIFDVEKLGKEDLSNANLKEFVEMNTQEAANQMVKESKNKKRYYSVD